MTISASSQIEQLALKFLALCLLIGLIYWPGLHGGFIADDFPNIVDKNGIQVHHLNFEEIYSAWSANSSGALKRPIASVSFALNYFFSGQKLISADFKLTNIVIHILNAFLVLLISQKLFSVLYQKLTAQILGFICALVWALHPLQLTSVLYVVQRMNSLSFSFMLAGFWVYLTGRLNLDKPGRIWLMYAGCLGGTALAVITKENGALLPFLMLITEITLFRSRTPKSQPEPKHLIYTFYALTAVIPAILAIAYLLSHPDFVLGAYTFRDFNLTERLMTQARALFYYLGLLIYPDNTELGLFHDDFAISRSLFEPITTLPAIFGIFLLLSVAGWCIYKKQQPLVSFAIAWFLVGHSMESSIFPLEIMFEHRNYVPSFGIIFGVVGIIYPLTQKIQKTALVNCLYVGLIFSLAAATYSRTNIWSSPGTIAYFEMRNHPHSVRAQTAYAKYAGHIKGENTIAYEHYIIAAKLDQHDVSALIEGYIALNRVMLKQPINETIITSLPESFGAPLVLNKDYLNNLLEKLNQQILERLASKPNATSTMPAIRVAVNCLVDHRPECQGMAETIKGWAKTAGNNPYYPDKAMMAVITAKIYFYQGNIDGALEELASAINYEPETFYYYGEKATLYLAVEELDKAEQVLNQAAATLKLLGDDLLEISRLKETIANGRLIIAKANKIDQGR